MIIPPGRDRRSARWTYSGAVEKHISPIFTTLGLPPAGDDHRRVIAVLRWLGA